MGTQRSTAAPIFGSGWQRQTSTPVHCGSSSISDFEIATLRYEPLPPSQHGKAISPRLYVCVRTCVRTRDGDCVRLNFLFDPFME